MKSETAKRMRIMKQAFLPKPYRYYAVLVIVGYISTSIFFNKLYLTLPVTLGRPLFFVPFVLLNCMIAVLLALVINLIVYKVRDMGIFHKHSGLAAVGAFAGLVGGSCPGCFVGVFPALAGLFGVTLSLGKLPFHGLEVLAASAALLTLSAFLLAGQNSCKVKIPK